MTIIPPHYSDRFINQRYNKALYIVQHLPISSNVQPTKEQKLELYSLYKQVTQGNINIPRPGIFDVVGRAKWDAWKKLENVSSKEAKFRYVEILLKVATEAFKKPTGRVEAHQIIQSFAAMHPNDSGDSSSEESYEEEAGSSAISEDAEEIAYLRQIRGVETKSTRPNHLSTRPRSRASLQSMMTAPSESRRLSISSHNSNRRRPMSVASSQSIRHGRPPREMYDDGYDDSVNPWVLQPSDRQYRLDARFSQQDYSHLYRSPLSASSSVTATQQYMNEGGLSRSVDSQNAVLGPATKKALESLQNEIEALNERINGLRKELVERDQKSKKGVIKKSDKSSDEDGWKWVFKAAVKHAIMNVMTACILIVFLYKNESPIAYAILSLIQRFWRRLSPRALIDKLLT